MKIMLYYDMNSLLQEMLMVNITIEKSFLNRAWQYFSAFPYLIAQMNPTLGSGWRDYGCSCKQSKKK